jgi:hypothetical protein
MNRSSGRFDEIDRRAEMNTGLADFSVIEKTGYDRRSWTREENLRIVEEAAHPPFNGGVKAGHRGGAKPGQFAAWT